MTLRRGVQRGLGSLTSVPLVIGIVIVINLLALAFFVRFDLTSSRLYSLSDASKRLARSLDDPVLAKLYFTTDLPAPYNANARYLKDQLYEYRAYSGGQLRIELIDPIRDNREEEAQAAGVPPIQVNAYEKDRIELKKVYMGAVFLYEDKKDVIPVVQSTANLEYEISSSIKKITAARTPAIGLLGGHGETSASDQFRSGYEALSRLYDVRPVTIEPGRLIDSTLSALIIGGPTDSITPWSQYAVDQYVMGGGKLAVFYDPVSVDLRTQEAKNRITNWPQFLAHYGIRIQQSVVIDARNARIAVMQQQGYIRMQNVVDYPFLPEVSYFNRNNLLGKDLKAVVFPFVSPLDSTLADSLGLRFETVCWSSEHSGVRHAPYNINPMQDFRREDFDKPYQILAGTIQGAFKTAFPDGPPPDTAVQSAVVEPARKQSPLTRIVVVGDGEFFNDQSMRNPSNAALFLNAVDWLTQDEGLISIRSRAVTVRPLDDVSDGTRRTVKFGNIFVPGILVIVFGVLRWQTRRRAKRD